MPTRRRVLGAVCAGVATGLAGCQGIIEVSASAEASPAAVRESAAAEAGYEHVGTEPDTLATEVSAFPYVADFEATWWLARYRKRLSDGGVARFEVMSSPTEKVKGTQLNPISNFEYGPLVTTFSTSSGEGPVGKAFSSVLGDGDFADVARVETTERDLLGEPAEFGVFDATFTGARRGSDRPVPVRVHLAVAERDGDVVVPVGVYPREADDSDAVYRLVEGLEHPADATGSSDAGDSTETVA
ncbi:DUF6517 family protein [Halorussus limi]|uniref:DUF6517 family protein n=1 Tax=Halorussus limi TaxID=2938695 RepID=A0A8U0HSF5_9EURY|nr:DUF6517 family protein [Halorussus limi]UPV74005.1 DUF6517 family protein [Halorussus limi]